MGNPPALHHSEGGGIRATFVLKEPGTEMHKLVNKILVLQSEKHKQTVYFLT